MIKVAILEYEKETKEILYELGRCFHDLDWTFRIYNKASDLAKRMKYEEYQLFIFDEVFKTPRLESVFVHDNPNAIFIYVCENPIRTKQKDQRTRVLYLKKETIALQIQEQKEYLISQCSQSNSYELNYGGVHVNLPYQDIYFLDKMDKMIYFHTKKGEFHMRASMQDLEKDFEEYGFLRVHVSYLVNTKHIVAWYKDEVELATGEKIPLSRAQKKKILALKRLKKTID